MADRSVKLLLTADVRGLTSALKTGAQATKDFTRDLDSWAKKNEKQLDTLGKGAMVAGGVLAAGVGLAVKSFADFDKSMSSVQAATHETEGNMAKLRKAAIDAGADTAFSASEAAGAIEELAKAGVSTADIMGGGLDGSLALAAAGALDVGTAAELSATALTQFKLSGEQIPHVADLLAAGAGKAQGSVQDMGAALKQSGLVASQVGLTIEETTGGLAAFASAGLVGSDAGTSFKSMLQRLTPQSEKAATTMDELGLNAYDAQGNFVGLSEYAGILQQGLAHMTAEQRNSTMATLFGSDAVRAAAVLYEQGAEGVQKWEDAVNDAGYAAETAAIMQDNLAGDIEKLGGSLDSVFLKSGSGANDVLRGLVQGLEGVVDAVGDIPEPILNIGLMFAGVAGGAALMGGAAITAIPKIRDTVEVLRDLNASGSQIPGIMGKSAKAVGVAAVAYAAFATAAKLASDATDADRTKTSVEQFTNALTGLGEAAPGAADALDRVFGGVVKNGSGPGVDGMFTAVNDLESALKRIGDPTMHDSIGDFFGDLPFVNAVTGADAARRAMADLDGAFAQLATSGSVDDAAAGFKRAWDQGQLLGMETQELVDLFPQYRDTVSEAATANGITQMTTEDLVYAMLGMGPAALGAASGLAGAAGATGELGGEAATTAESLDDILESLFALGLLTMSSRDATAAFEGSLRDAKQTVTDLAAEEAKLNETGETLGSVLQKNGKDFDLASEAGSRANAAFQDVARSGMAEFEAKAREGAGTKELQGSLKDTYNGMVTTAKGFGMGAKEANALAREVLGVPDGVSVKSWMSDAAKRAAEETSRALDLLDGRTVNTYANHHNTTFVKTVNEGWADSNRAPQSTKGPKKGFATGGPIHGPGTGTSDSIPALLSNGEHVWTADEVRKAGGHAGLERMRGLAKAGLLPAFAKGGRVGWSKRDQSADLKRLRGATADRKQEERDQKAAQRAYDAIDGTKDNRPAKQAAKRRLDAAKKATERAKKAEAAAKSEYEDAKARTGRLSLGAFDLKRDLKRGSITESFASGSGMSVVDRLFDESRNEDLSKRQRSNLRSTGYRLESQLLKLEKQSDKLAASLEKATAKRDELLAVRDQVASGLRSEFSLSGMLSDTRQDLASNPFTAVGISKRANQMARRIEIFAGRLNRLRKMGYGETIIQEVAALGTTDGIQVAGVLMNATKGEKNSIIGAYERLDKASGKAGQYVTESMYKGGLNAAEGLVRGLESKQKDVESAFYQLGKQAEKAFKRSLGIKSPSRVMMGAADDTVDGLTIQLGRRKSDVDSSMASLVTVPKWGTWGVNSVPRSPEVAAHAAASGIDYERLASAVVVAAQSAPVHAEFKIDQRQFATAVTLSQRQVTNRRGK